MPVKEKTSGGVFLPKPPEKPPPPKLRLTLLLHSRGWPIGFYFFFNFIQQFFRKKLYFQRKLQKLFWGRLLQFFRERRRLTMLNNFYFEHFLIQFVFLAYFEHFLIQFVFLAVSSTKLNLLFHFSTMQHQSLEPLAPFLGVIDIRAHWLLCTGFNAQQLLFQVLFHTICIFGSIKPQTESTFPFQYNVTYQSLELLSSTPGRDRHVRSLIFVYGMLNNFYFERFLIQFVFLASSRP